MKSTQKQLALLIACSTVAMCAPMAKSQFAYKDTVGNESENNQKYMFAVNEARTFRTGIISNPNLRQSTSISGFPSRHTRQEGATGIGGSSFQTTSITSESAPALIRPLTLSVGSPTIGRPDLSVRFGSALSNPALSSFQIHSPGVGDETGISASPESFTNTRSLVPNVFSPTSSPNDEFRFGD
jgi:hypothetical protein